MGVYLNAIQAKNNKDAIVCLNTASTLSEFDLDNIFLILFNNNCVSKATLWQFIVENSASNTFLLNLFFNNQEILESHFRRFTMERVFNDKLGEDTSGSCVRKDVYLNSIDGISIDLCGIDSDSLKMAAIPLSTSILKYIDTVGSGTTVHEFYEKFSTLCADGVIDITDVCSIVQDSQSITISIPGCLFLSLLFLYAIDDNGNAFFLTTRPGFQDVLGARLLKATIKT